MFEMKHSGIYVYFGMWGLPVSLIIDVELK